MTNFGSNHFIHVCSRSARLFLTDVHDETRLKKRDAPPKMTQRKLIVISNGGINLLPK